MMFALAAAVVALLDLIGVDFTDMKALALLLIALHLLLGGIALGPLLRRS